MDTWISPSLTDGLCNRLFQVVAGMYYSKLWNYPLVFFVPRISLDKHSDCSVIFKLFPQIPIVYTANSFDTVKEIAEDFMDYKLLEKPNGKRIVLVGYHQSEKYFPSEITLPFENILSPQRMKELEVPSAYWWIHVRLGDYLTLDHHRITTSEYWKKVVQMAGDTPIIIYSNELEKASLFLKELCPNAKFIQFQSNLNLTPIETLYQMSLCGGGCIGSNSSFSWWGMYISLAKKLGNPCILPRPWHKHVPIEKTSIYSQWNTIVDV
jgi:hypothetical protein